MFQEHYRRIDCCFLKKAWRVAHGCIHVLARQRGRPSLWSTVIGFSCKSATELVRTKTELPLAF
jgi:hypothetical protein